MKSSLHEIPLHTLFFKTIYSHLRTVNADMQPPHLPVNMTCLLKIKEFCKWVFRILPRLRAGVSGTMLIVNANNWSKVSVSKHKRE